MNSSATQPHSFVMTVLRIDVMILIRTDLIIRIVMLLLLLVLLRFRMMRNGSWLGNRLMMVIRIVLRSDRLVVVLGVMVILAQNLVMLGHRVVLQHQTVAVVFLRFRMYLLQA